MPYSAYVIVTAKEYLALSRKLLREGWDAESDQYRTSLHWELARELGLSYEETSGDEIVEKILGVRI